ncbi:hypothetical protein RFI_17298 [Reticulomyxa filosa]|uniref:Uncharacterized protein n=1 Tax=Reticulomyxa filosa TaxID=46433 RepID=X6N219_RETFI|nr:hypothetical protein RFI_17298 [Reticulomyxa filosa]|eukprot:ETO19923.1 hypothetical protein RFI_17298 [Reticulomyxa filosa]
MTYEKFWVEVIPDNVYFTVKGLNTKQKNHRMPIDSIIGATIDSSMQISLAIQASFHKPLKGEGREIEFELYIRKPFVEVERGIGVDLAMSNTTQQNSHSCDTYVRDDVTPVEGQWVTKAQQSPPVYGIGFACDSRHVISNSRFQLFSFIIDPSSVANGISALNPVGENGAHLKKKNNKTDTGFGGKKLLKKSLRKKKDFFFFL